MIKKLSAFLFILATTACSPAEDQTPQETPAAPNVAIEDKTFSFDAASLKPGCDEDSEIVCAVNLNAKCTLNPHFSECQKGLVPNFVFMEDESLGRPTRLSYKLQKIKPINAEMIEVHTVGTCDGNWFGLCQGNIIYVMAPRDGRWVVKDIYALGN